MKTPIEESDILLMVNKAMEFPFSKICIHSVALDLLNLLESHGYEIDNELVKAISNCDNEKALKIMNKS